MKYEDLIGIADKLSDAAYGRNARTWKQYKDLPYLVSDDGHVFSTTRKHLITERSSYDGYRQAGISVNGKRKPRLVHRMVAEALMPCDNSDRLVVNHLDLDRCNNRLDNLEWCTHKQNIRHAVGLVISDDDINTIRHNVNSGLWSQQDVVNLYNVSSAYISNVIQNKTRIDPSYKPSIKYRVKPISQRTVRSIRKSYLANDTSIGDIAARHHISRKIVEGIIYNTTKQYFDEHYDQNDRRKTP